MEISFDHIEEALQTSDSFEEAVGKLSLKDELPDGFPVEGYNLEGFRDDDRMEEFRGLLRNNTLLKGTWRDVEKTIHFFRNEGDTDGNPDRISVRDLFLAPSTVLGEYLPLAEFGAALLFSAITFQALTEEKFVPPWDSAGGVDQSIPPNFPLRALPEEGLFLSAESVEAILIETLGRFPTEGERRGQPNPRRVARDILGSFRDPKRIRIRLAKEGEIFYRYTNIRKARHLGRFLTKTDFSSTAAAREGLNIGLYGNRGKYRHIVRAIRPTRVLEGEIAKGHPRAVQSVLLNPGDFEFVLPGRPSPIRIIGHPVPPVKLTGGEGDPEEDLFPKKKIGRGKNTRSSLLAPSRGVAPSARPILVPK